MSTLVIGREIVAEALRSGDARPYIEAGLTLDFMRDQLHPAYAAVFTGQDIDAWLSVLRHQSEFSKVPDITLFRAQFPAGTYDLPTSRTTAAELVALAHAAINQYETEVGNSEAARYIDAGDYDSAAEVMLATARRVLRQQSRGAIRRSWDNPEYDLDQRLDVTVGRGPGFGIPELDYQDGFSGFQDGQLITVLGRAKANKTTLLVASAFNAWMGKSFMRNGVKTDVDPRRVMIVTTEITEDGIRDRLTCYGAGVDPGPFLASTEDYRPNPQQRAAIKKFWDTEVREYAAGAVQVVQPLGRYTVADIEMDAESAEPAIIYVDGFYFLTDPATGRMGAHWEAHDNLARELKSLAMRLNVPVFVTHQAREKQLGKAGGGIDDSAMMGGTGLRMASDLVVGLDKDKEGVVTINNTASRGAYLKAIRGEWNWASYRFDVHSDWDGEGDEE